jgi:hypothetical protein
MSALGPGCVKTFFRPQKLLATGDDPRRHDGLSIFLLYRVWSQPGRNLRLTLSDLNGRTMRITARALHARIATRSGLMPTMFITRVRL